VLAETATELRQFDARKWDDLAMPESVWIVTTDDGVIHCDFQRASADHLGTPMVDLESDHRAPTCSAEDVAEIIEDSFATFEPIGGIGGSATEQPAQTS
jgi:hypothetical protein